MAKRSPLYIGYIRVSTEEQVHKGFSPEVQQERIEQYVQHQCHDDTYELVFYRDLGYTGKYGIRQYPELFPKIRPGLSDAVDRMTAEAEERPVHIVCLGGSRLERKPLLAELLWDQIFIPLGIRVHSVDEGGELDSSPTGQLTRRVSSASSATVPAYTSRRVKQAHDYRASKGYLHCVPPYGWKRLPKDDNQRWHDIGPVPEEYEVLLEMKEKALGGWGTWRIAKWLGQQGIEAPRNSQKWYPQTVADLLRNPIQAGHFRHRDEVLEGRHLDRRFWDIHTTEELTRVLTQRHRASKRGITLGAFLLAGVLTCGYCGSALSSTYDSKSGNRYYKCTNMTSAPADYHVSISKIATDLETAIEEDLRRVLDTSELHQITEKQIDEVSETKTAELASQNKYLKRRLRDLGEDLAAAISRNRRGELGEVALASVQEHLEAQIEQIQHRSQEIEQRLTSITANSIRLQRAKQAAKSFDTIWDTMDTEERRGLLQTLIEDVVVTREGQGIRLHIRYHFLPEATCFVPHGMGTPKGSDLTRRELETLLLYSRGLTCTQIAQRFNVSLSTPRQHLYTVRKKLGVNTNKEAVEAAWDTIQQMRPYLKLSGRRRSKPDSHTLLSSTELELLCCFAEGLSYDYACQKLGISKSAAYSRAVNARRKLEVDSNDAAISTANELGLL